MIKKKLTGCPERKSIYFKTMAAVESMARQVRNRIISKKTGTEVLPI